MYQSKQHDCPHQESKGVLSHSFTSKEEFVIKYKKLYYGTANAEVFYVLVLRELEKAISEGNINHLNRLSKLIDYISEIEDPSTLRNYYDNSDNPIKFTNTVIIACKHNKEKSLEYLFGNDTKILDNLSTRIRRAAVLPDDEDESCHNAFYYAVRSGNIKLLDILVKRWPGDYFCVHPGQLDEILSGAYEELKLKNVPMSGETEVFVEKMLVNLRFFSDSLVKAQYVQNDLSKIRERIMLLLGDIDLLTAEYLNAKAVDERFLYMAQFIAQNINILKQHLKSTYDRLPWEEIEFCLVSFISSRTKPQKVNVIWHTVLNKGKLLNHLNNFANKLKYEQDVIERIDIRKLAETPKLKREKVVGGIISKSPQFEELYNDYHQIRDIYSLEKISEYIKLTYIVNPKNREGQLVIIRVLQVIGEHLKNTLESPKMSNNTSELLILSLPKSTRDIIIGLRNSLSHSYSLSKRSEIEENADTNFFTGVQNDIKKIQSVITEILDNSYLKMGRVMLEKLVKIENLEEIKEVFKVFNNAEWHKMIPSKFRLMEHEKLEKLTEEFSNYISNKTVYEKEQFNKINQIINFVNNKSDIKTDYMAAFAALKTLSISLYDAHINSKLVREIKFFANQVLKNINPKVVPQNLKEITELSSIIFQSVRPRLKDGQLDEVKRLICEIFYIAEFGMRCFKWIEELRNKLDEQDSIIIPKCKQNKSYRVTKQEMKNELSLKLSELKSILSNNAIGGELTDKLPYYKSNKELQAVVEMLVLDMISILGRSKKYLEKNIYFLDENTPVLIGRCMRNHLAHDNALVNILLSDPYIAVTSNAENFISKNIIESNRKVGKFVRDDPSKLKNKHEKYINTIGNQKNMFNALKEGNLKSLENCLKKGADIMARSFNLWTSLHFASKGPSLEVVRFVLSQNVDPNVKDVNGQCALHVAAAYGRKNIVEFLLKEGGLHVDSLDNKQKTALHCAARYGHKDTVEALLKNKANIAGQDIFHFTPLHYAVVNNHVDVSKILLKQNVNVDVGGFTPLHNAAENGHLELVNFMLQNNADVNARNERDWTPLHAAAFNGHVEVVKALILQGAHVNARVINGCTPLHYAVENGHEEIANILLKHGAQVDAIDKTYKNTPLHYVAKDGYERIVDALLGHGANPNAANSASLTPLHLAASNGHLGIVITLLKHGADLCAKETNGAISLHGAAGSDHKEVVELLIKNGAEINATTNENLTPLHLAAGNGQINIIDLLIKNKAVVNNRDIRGRTPLHAAVLNTNKDVIDVLIHNKAEVDARDNNGVTPLHAAAVVGNVDAIIGLIKHKAEVNTSVNDYNFTPLHSAVMKGHKSVVNFLIENKAQVDAKDVAGNTPLLYAVTTGNEEIVQILSETGANVNVKSNNETPLLCAIKYNHKGIVEYLTSKGADVNSDGGEPVQISVFAGYHDIVDILLKNKVCINIEHPKNVTLLHVAASRGHKEIVKSLIMRGANVDAVTTDNTTSLFMAAQEGHEEVVELLIASGANVNFKNTEGSPIHIAAVKGHDTVVEVLLKKGININVKDNQSRTPLELAVSYGHLQVVKMLLKSNKVDMNNKGNDDWTLLHIASQESNLKMVKYLVENGSDINAKNSSGSKPIHIAAREGYKETVEFFLQNGSSINDLGTANQTLLHYAAMKGRLEVVKYLIKEGADINAKDVNGFTPMHVAAVFHYKEVIEVLLRNGAVYNAVNKFYRSPLKMASDKNIINLLASTDKLFEAARHNRSTEVEEYIKLGAFVNPKSTDGGTPLHYASWKGYGEVADVLLENEANPNAVGSKGFTPLHYAAKYSHLNIVKALLSNGAVYNCLSDSGKTPSDFSVDARITKLFTILDDSFKNIKNDNSRVIYDLNKIKDVSTIKAIMCANNRENKTLIVAAVQRNFSKTKEMKEILQGNVSSQINLALELLNGGDYKPALSILTSAFERRKAILGSDNPGTSDIQIEMANVLYAEGSYQEALNLFEEIFHKQKKILGLNDKSTLSTRNAIALVLHRQGKDEEAFDIYQEVYQKQKELLGPHHSDTLETQLHMALTLDKLGKYEEALYINRVVFERKSETLGVNHPDTVRAQNNIAMVLGNQGKYEEALQMYEEVLKRKKQVFGINHADTLRTLQNIAGVLACQKKYAESLKAYNEVLSVQRNVLGPNHPDTLISQYNLGNLYFNQGKRISALKTYRGVSDQMKAVFGPNHPSIFDITEKIKIINMNFRLDGSKESEIVQHLQSEINIAASNGDIESVESLLKDGANVNDRDIEGRTPLHYAVSYGHLAVVNILLKNGADVTQATNKGNTALHTATSKNDKEIMKILLQHVSCEKLNYFINAKTTSGGTTALHVAAKNGSFEVVKSLLEHGAIYNIQNKEGKTPFNLSKDKSCTELLEFVDDLFRDILKGKVEIINRLRSAKYDEFIAIANARNTQGKTLLQVAVANQHKDVASKLLEMLKCQSKY